VSVGSDLLDVLLNGFESFTQGYDYQAILQRITCPVLFLRGEVPLGGVMTDDEIRSLQTNCGNVKCVIIDGVGHLLRLQDHGQAPVLREMTAFVDQV
jgi:pimeloyl-ACP methyl ester carboxylesterase